MHYWLQNIFLLLHCSLYLLSNKCLFRINSYNLMFRSKHPKIVFFFKKRKYIFLCNRAVLKFNTLLYFPSFIFYPFKLVGRQRLFLFESLLFLGDFFFLSIDRGLEEGLRPLNILTILKKINYTIVWIKKINNPKIIYGIYIYINGT